MPAKQKIYKVDVNQLAEDVALFGVTEQFEEGAIIGSFCRMYSIPLDDALIAEKSAQFQLIADQLAKAKKAKDPKAK